MTSPLAPPATLRLTVDTAALAANWRALDALSGSASAGAAVKADAYGLGVDTCVPVLRDAGCTNFFVAHWSEVAAVAAHVPADQIAVLHGVLSEADCAYARSIGAVPVINSLEQAALWQATGGGRCHLMVDTGINRLGIAQGEVLVEVNAADPSITVPIAAGTIFGEVGLISGRRRGATVRAGGDCIGHYDRSYAGGGADTW